MPEMIRKVRTLLRTAGTVIGTEAVRVVHEHFEREALIGEQEWAPRRAGSPRNSRKILSDTNNLRDSVRHDVRDMRVIVGIDLAKVPYARIHNEGGTIEQTKKSRAYFWAKYMETGDEFFKRLALAKGPFVIPARPYLQITAYMEQRIMEALAEILD